MIDTADIDGPPAVETVQPVAELFTGAASALWATTYNVDLALFNEFLLPRLGDSPLNVVVLADHRRLTASLDRIPPERTDTLAAVNRRWLLRGVWPGGQAFHPKTYLAVAGSRATLLVGSGNLSTSGLDEGREVFTTFRSGTPVGDSAIASWQSWMRRLVELVDDVSLAERFRDLEGRLPARQSDTPHFASPVLHNLDTAIAAQLAAVVAAEAAGGVDELLLAAPFYDDDCDAVGRLLTNLAPRRVRIFIAESTSVNGQRLTERLAASGAEIEVIGYEPDRYVHAKLIGIITGARSWLLSGSANLSRAALTRTVGSNGNIELAVLAALDADNVRAAFIPPGTQTIARSISSLTTLNFRSDPEPELPRVRLVTATQVQDGRVEIVSQPSAEPGWLLDDLIDPQPIILDPHGRTVTAGPLTERLVQLINTEGDVLSNRVVVDDPAALAATLTTGPTRPDTNRPPELTEGDLESPLGQALQWLHRNLVMDVSQRITTAPTGGVTADEADDQTDDDLWERLEQEQLARDPRASTYRRMWNRNELGDTDPIIELLDALRARTPTEPATGRFGRSLLAHLLDHQDDNTDSNDPKATGRRWKPSTRIRVRARNFLRRCADAQTDPRLMWVDPLAPAGNFAVITSTLADLHLQRSHGAQHVELTDEDLNDLWMRWLRLFAGTGQGDGWLDQLDPAALAIAHQKLEWLRETMAALCCLALWPDHIDREQIIDAQPVLAAALSHGLIDPTDMTARYLSAITGHTITREQIDDHLLDVLAFIDDDLWCAHTATELALDDLKLQAPPGASSIQVRLNVRGIDDPLLDPRIPRLVAAAHHYRRCTGIALYAADTGWRIAAIYGEKIAYLPSRGQDDLESINALTNGLVEQLIASGGVLADLFPSAEKLP